MVPIGRGQRELIIGDRQTGKTAIAVDTIINQKGQGVHCIYVAIGQKSSTVANIVKTFEEYGAMDYTTVVASTASELAPLQQIAPYAGCAIGEEWMENGEDVLVIYDDLSKHATAYRTRPFCFGDLRDVRLIRETLLSSLKTSGKGSQAVRSTGRRFSHSPSAHREPGRRCICLYSDECYFHHGRRYLSGDRDVQCGFRPAIMRVSPYPVVGGAAQIKAMKKIAGPICTYVAQYRELAAFAQFGSELDDEQRKSVWHRVRGLRKFLKQPQYLLLPVEQQVVIDLRAYQKISPGDQGG